MNNIIKIMISNINDKHNNEFKISKDLIVVIRTYSNDNIMCYKNNNLEIYFYYNNISLWIDDQHSMSYNNTNIMPILAKLDNMLGSL